MTPERAKRTWHYLLQPKQFEMGPCECGNFDLQWSEWERHLWCDKCQIDFIPENKGVFDGPIPGRIAALLGMTFDRYNMDTQRVERFDLDTGDWKIS